MKLVSLNAGAAVGQLSVLMLVLVILAGCGPTPPIEGQRDPYDPAQVHFTSRELRRDTAVGTPVATRDEHGLLHVTVPIRSTRARQLHVDYRVTFFDRNRQAIGQPTGWMGKVLEPRVFDQIQVNSTSPLAEDFRVDLRHSQ
jgi:hypothetical protein